MVTFHIIFCHCLTQKQGACQSGLIFIPEFIKNNLPLLIMILSGGMVYTFGMIPFAVLRQKSGAHFLWHFFVLAGAIVQFIGILLFIY